MNFDSFGKAKPTAAHPPQAPRMGGTAGVTFFPGAMPTATTFVSR